MDRNPHILSLMNFRTLLALAVISSPAIAQKSDTAAVKAAVIAADRALAAAAAKNAAAYLSALTKDAAVLFPGQPILRGPDQARTAFMARYGGASSYEWTPAHAVASTDGKLACTMGYSRFTNALDSVKTPHSGT
jgi:ketosteroid isomerase-like protein